MSSNVKYEPVFQSAVCAGFLEKNYTVCSQSQLFQSIVFTLGNAYDCSCHSMTQVSYACSYLYANKSQFMKLNLLYGVGIKFPFLFLQIYYTIIKTQRSMQYFVNCSSNQNVYVCVITPQHGDPYWPWPQKTIVLFCPRTSHSSFHDTGCFRSSLHERLQCHPQMFREPNHSLPPQ